MKYVFAKISSLAFAFFICAIASSTRFELLQSLTLDLGEHRRKQYIDFVKSPDARIIYTRLRIDSHLLQSSQAKLNKSSDGLCKNCARNTRESPEHFLLHCEKFSTIRKEMYEAINRIDYKFSTMNSMNRMKYLLDLRCPEQCISLCCSLVNKLYHAREKIEANI